MLKLMLAIVAMSSVGAFAADLSPAEINAHFERVNQLKTQGTLAALKVARAILEPAQGELSQYPVRCGSVSEAGQTLHIDASIGGEKYTVIEELDRVFMARNVKVVKGEVDCQ